jgi:CCR4-NOT transcriptional regulation complex NOT5 subunit
MKSLVKYLNDLHISQDDSVFQDDLKEIYEKIIFFAEEPLEITYDMFNASFANLPKINDYLPPKQTKENSYRSSICPTYKMIDLSVIPKMPKELLFFMFYMHKNETEQYLAAKEIMRRGWRYYTRFHMWIKRCGHPNFDLAE